MHTFVRLTHIPNRIPDKSSHILPPLADKRFFAAAISLIYACLSEFTKHINLSCLFIVVVFFTKYVNFYLQLPVYNYSKRSSGLRPIFFCVII